MTMPSSAKDKADENYLTIVVTWLDGPQEIYHCQEATVCNGVLELHKYHGPIYNIPLITMRCFTTEWA